MKIDDIILCKPVIVHAALDDMENEQKEQALRLLHGKKLLTMGKLFLSAILTRILFIARKLLLSIGKV